MTEMDRRIFYSPDFESANELPEDESAHCLRVLRYGIGDEIEVTDAFGRVYRETMIRPKAFGPQMK